MRAQGITFKCPSVLFHRCVGIAGFEVSYIKMNEVRVVIKTQIWVIGIDDIFTNIT